MKKRTIKLRFKLLLLACFLAYTGFVIFSQQANIGKLMEEQQSLSQKYHQMQIDLSRLQYKSEYMSTKDYVENETRKKFGLVYEDELIFDTSQKNDD